MHMKHVGPKVVGRQDELLVVAASLGTKKRRRAIRIGIEDVISQVTSRPWEVAFWPADSDPCLQVADYCTWAVQRTWRSGTTAPICGSRRRFRRSTTSSNTGAATTTALRRERAPSTASRSRAQGLFRHAEGLNLCRHHIRDGLTRGGWAMPRRSAPRLSRPRLPASPCARAGTYPT
jgi:hypothetical protein